MITCPQIFSLLIFLSCIPLTLLISVVTPTINRLFTNNGIAFIIVILSVTLSDTLLLSFQLNPSRTWLKLFSGPTGKNSPYPNPNLIWFHYCFIVSDSLWSLFCSLPNLHSMVFLHHPCYHYHNSHYLHHRTPLSFHLAYLENPNRAQIQPFIHTAECGWRKNPTILPSHSFSIHDCHSKLGSQRCQAIPPPVPDSMVLLNGSHSFSP